MAALSPLEPTRPTMRWRAGAPSIFRQRNGDPRMLS